jgi:hypothetical protein
MVFWFCRNKTKQNQTITKCFSKFGTNPNPTQTEPNPKELESVATLIQIIDLLFSRFKDPEKKFF